MAWSAFGPARGGPRGAAPPAMRGMGEERNRGGGPGAATNPLAHGDCGPMLRCSSSTMQPTSFPPRASPRTRKPHVRGLCYYSDTLLEPEIESESRPALAVTLQTRGEDGAPACSDG